MPNFDLECFTITTKRTLIRPVTLDDTDLYVELFSDSDVMEKYATGQTKDVSVTKSRVEGWVDRFKNHDPYNGMAVFDRETGEFIGHVVIGRGDEPGQAELAYLFHKKFWGQGFGSEIVMAMVNGYLPKIADIPMDGHKVTRIEATVRTDHLASQRILEKAKLSTDKAQINEKFGKQRYIYKADVVCEPKATSQVVRGTLFASDGGLSMSPAPKPQNDDASKDSSKIDKQTYVASTEYGR